MKPFFKRWHKRIALALLTLFLVLALVPVYCLMAKLSPGGKFVQLCSSSGIQTVWVADDRGDGLLQSANLLGKTSLGASEDVTNTGHSSGANPFGSCEFCWMNVLATTLLLAVILFFSPPKIYFFASAWPRRAFQSFIQNWHAHPRAPPLYALI